MKKLGIVAGAGELPKLVIEACQQQGRPYFVIALKGHADSSSMPPEAAWVRLGAVGKSFELAHANAVEDILMIGAVRRPTLQELRPDWRGLKFFAKAGVKSLGDDGLLKAIIHEIEKDGFHVIGADEILKNCLSHAGVYGKIKPTKQNYEDISKGYKVAKILGQADVGQSVIIADGLVLGVEAIEGTDALIKRCKTLHQSSVKGVLVKVKKPRQERRADLPTIGIQTVKLAKEAGLAGIAVEKDSAFIVHEKEVVQRANKEGLFLIGIDETCQNF